MAAARPGPKPGPTGLLVDPMDAGRPALAIFRDKDGLPQNAAMALAFDQRGYLWVGTQDGLAIYNGRSWKVEDLPNRTQSNFVRSMTITSDDAVWCGRENGGISRFAGGEWRTWNEKDGLPEGRINAIAVTRDARGGLVVWAGGVHGVARFSAADDSWKKYSVESGLPGEYVTDILIDDEPGGEPAVWVATSRGLARFNGNGFSRVALPVGRTDESVDCLGRMTNEAGRSELWAAVGIGQIAVFDGSAWTSRTIDATDAIQCFAETTAPDNKRTLWVGTDGSGLLRFQDGQWRSFNTSNGLPNNSIWNLLPVGDASGTRTLWLGTDGGLGRLELNGWTAFDAENGLPTNSTYAIGESVEPNGTHSMWFGTRGAGLARLRNGEWTDYTVKDGLPANSVFSLVFATNDDGTRTLWAGTQGAGLAKFNGDRWEPVEVPNVPRPTVRRMIERVGEDGRREILAATGGSGILTCKRGVWSQIDTSLTELKTSALFCLVASRTTDNQPALWVGSQGRGVACNVGQQWTVFNTSNSKLPNDSILCLLERRSREGRRQLWAGTEGGGIAMLDLDDPASTWTILSDGTRPALPNNTVYQLCEDASGRIYAFTNKGCARLTEREADAEGAPFEIYVFRTEDGLPSNEFNGGASFVDSAGRIWAGTPAGVAAYDPRRETRDVTKKPLVIERAALLGGGVPVLEGQELGYNQNSLTFEYSLLSFYREKDTRYRTQLIGLDGGPTDWTPDFKRAFTTLPEGSYTFCVWARDYAGNETGPVEFPFEVRAAPWRTWWAYLLYVVAAVGLTWLLIRARLDALRRRNVELEAGIAERTAQLAEKVDELEIAERSAQAARDDALRAKDEALEANRAKSIFLSNMSHELRTPLNAVLGFAQLMDRDADRKEDDRESLGIIMRSGEHLLGLINDVLSISKIEAGKLTLNSQPFDLRRLLQGLEEMLGVRAQAKGLTLMFDLEPDLPQYVSGDEGKLRQVLINLLNNAVKFTETGGVALRAGWESGRARFEVQDTGQGIAPDEIDGIFDAFVQSESGRTAKEGTGLGLAISRNFVRLMDGDISVRSRPGEGTVFSFDVELPIADSMELPRAQRRVVSLEAGQPEQRLLVVDDRWENRALLVKLLRAVGFAVRDAADGRQAVDAWLEWKPALIWMDMRMPVMDGRAATAEIRRLEGSSRTTRIIALTASAFEHERSAVLAAGCDDFVTKPYREATIFEKLEEHIGARFVYDEPGGTDESESQGLSRLTPENLDALPPGLVDELAGALTLGNVKDAQFVVNNIGQHDEQLADELRRLVRSYQFDEILDTIEARGRG